MISEYQVKNIIMFDGKKYLKGDKIKIEETTASRFPNIFEKLEQKKMSNKKNGKK